MARLHVGQAVRLSLAEDGSATSYRGVLRQLASGRLVVELTDERLPPKGFEVGRPVVLEVAEGAGAHLARTVLTGMAFERSSEVTLEPPASFKAGDRRRAPRLSTRLPTALVVSAAADAAMVGLRDGAARTLDFSATGLRMETALALQVGDRVNVEVAVPSAFGGNPSTLFFEGIVRRVVEAEPRSGSPAPVAPPGDTIPAARSAPGPFVVGIEFIESLADAWETVKSAYPGR